MLTEVPDRLPACPFCGESAQTLLMLMVSDRLEVACGRCRRTYRICYREPRGAKRIGFATAPQPAGSWHACRPVTNLKERRR